jgi:chlorobactene glucosyltransferase
MNLIDMGIDTIYYAVILIIGLYAFVFSLANIIYLYKETGPADRTSGALVSVLIPARNEEENIGRCLRSLRTQTYENYEILVLDDNSEDSTWDIINSCCRKDPHIRPFKGKELPSGWYGKNYALQQLIEHAQGEFLLFTDADTIHTGQSISFAVSNMEYHQADMISGYPKQLFPSISTQAVVSAMCLPLLFFPPLRLLDRLKMPMFSLAVGQYICVRSRAIEAVEGFTHIPNSITDDIHLARLFVSKGFKQLFLDVSDIVSCRMYSSFLKSFGGITRSTMGYLGKNILIPLAAIPVLFAFLVLPLPLLVFQVLTDSSISTGFMAGIVLMNAAWIQLTVFLRYPAKTFLLFFPTMSLILGVGIRGLYCEVTQRGYRWKKRIVR